MHWKHSKYQILHVIVANCHTYDEAYRVLRELEEDYQLSIDTTLSEHKRIQSKEIAANLILNDSEEQLHNKKNAEADKMMVEARTPVVQDCLNVARSTLEFIRSCINVIQPLRMFKHLPDADAHQCCQALEWKLDLVWKSYNMVCASGYVSYDHFASIKMHPECESILPVVESYIEMARTGRHSELLKYRKQDVFAKVVNTNEQYIDSVSKVFNGIQHDSHIPRLDARTPNTEIENG